MPTIRPATPNDRDAIFDLSKSFATSFVVEREAFDSSFDALLQSDDSILLVATYKEQIIGYLLGFDHPTFFANGNIAWIEEIMVAENSRRQGIGRQLMASFESWAKLQQSKFVALATRRAA